MPGLLALLGDLKQERELTLMFITHDLSVLTYACRSLAVMYAGRILEESPVGTLFRDPKHPYTRGLMGSIPGGAPGSRLVAIPGTVPAPGQLPPGCCFAPRCPSCFDPCSTAHPGITDFGGGRTVKCYLHGPVIEPDTARPGLPTAKLGHSGARPHA